MEDDGKIFLFSNTGFIYAGIFKVRHSQLHVGETLVNPHENSVMFYSPPKGKSDVVSHSKKNSEASQQNSVAAFS